MARTKSTKTQCGQKRALLRRPSKRQVVITIAVVLGLFAGWTLLAYSGAPESVFRQKGKKGAASIQSFNSNSPSKEYIYAGGRLVATEEPSSGGGCGSAPSAPSALFATAASATSLSLTWSASSTGAVDHYEVERRNGSLAFAAVATVPATPGTVSTTDSNGVIADTAYVYRVRAFDSANCPSPYSNIDLATTVLFTSDPPVAMGSTIYAVHLVRLATAVNAVKLTAGLGPFGWGDSIPPATVAPTSGGTIFKEQVQKLRNTLNQARLALGLASQSYTNEPLTQGVSVFKDHILELRQGVQ